MIEKLVLTPRRPIILRALALGLITCSAAALRAAEAPAAAAAADDAGLAEVVVTGSRIERAGFTAPTPTTIIGAADLEARAATVLSDVLYELPSVRPAPAPTGVSQAGGNFINLRGIGTSRTLTLVDGRRFVPTNGGNAGNIASVDLNVVPTALVERVDVVTGGASAAWGSDAVSGVINLVLRKKLEGFQGNAQYGASQHGDAKNQAFSLAWGSGFGADRGQFMVAGEYSKSYDMPTQADRDWSNKHTAFATRAVNGVTYTRVLTDGLTLTGLTSGGVIVTAGGGPLAATSPLYGKQFLTSTSSAPFNYGQLLGTSLAIGGDGGWISDQTYPVAPNERKNVYARTTFDLTDDVQAYAEASYAQSRTAFPLFPSAIPSSTDTPIQIFAANPYIPADIRTILTANPTITSFYLGRLTPEIGPLTTDSENQITRYVLGFKGKLAGDWTWDSYYTRGKTDFSTDFSNNYIEANLRAALDVVTNPVTGLPDCRINVSGAAAPGTPAFGAAAGCRPANPFGVGSLAANKDYIAGTLTNVVTYHQDAAGASIQGEPFSSWAGPVSTAFGVDYRRESLSQVVSPQSNFLNPPVFGAGGFQQANPKSFGGKNNVLEFYAETLIPLIEEKTFAKSVELNAAVRSTDYSNSGTVTTWKGGLTYKPFEGLLFRGTRSRDIRASGLFEQYGSAVTYGASLERAPGAAPGSQVTFSSITVGNTALKPESANTTTVGVTLSPAIIDGLSMSFDYYRINLKDSIGQLGAQGILDTCYGAGTAAGLAPDPSKCALINRAGAVITNQQLNLGTVKTAGFDAEISYRFDLGFAPGRMTVRLLGNFLDKLIFNTSGLRSIDRTDDIAGGPKKRMTLSNTYQNGRFTGFLQGRYVDRMNRDRSQTSATYFYDRFIPSRVYFDGSVQYTLLDGDRGTLQLYGSVDNLFDKDPPPVPGINGLTGVGAGQGGGVTSVTYYDTIGRAFTAGVRVKF